MDELLREVEACLQDGHFYVALFCCLALPDICAALESTDGKAKGQRYVAWFDKHMPETYSKLFSGSQCYSFRCSTLHQGTSSHAKLGYSRVVFIARKPTSKPVMHLNVLNDALNLDIHLFSRDVVNAVRNWLELTAADTTVRANMSGFLRRHSGGLQGYIQGIDVFS